MTQEATRLTFVGDTDERSTDNHKIGIWSCTCGKEVRVANSRVRNGYTKSCGCLSKEVSSRKATTHGKRYSREYSSWSAMCGRCLSPSHKDYPRYGKKGISVCPEWANSFEAFLADMGSRPAGTTLDRIDPSKGYEPGNCRWATPLEQARNRRDLTVIDTPSGRMVLVDYAAALGLTKGAAHLRMKRGTLKGCSYV